MSANCASDAHYGVQNRGRVAETVCVSWRSARSTLKSHDARQAPTCFALDVLDTSCERSRAIFRLVIRRRIQRCQLAWMCDKNSFFLAIVLHRSATWPRRVTKRPDTEVVSFRRSGDRRPAVMHSAGCFVASVADVILSFAQDANFSRGDIRSAASISARAESSRAMSSPSSLAAVSVCVI